MGGEAISSSQTLPLVKDEAPFQITQKSEKNKYMIMGPETKNDFADDGQQQFTGLYLRQCGILNISQPYRPPRLVTGIAFFFTRLEVAGPPQTGAQRTQSREFVM
jgi:hypothetical protein